MVSQGKTDIPGVDDGEEMQLTDVSPVDFMARCLMFFFISFIIVFLLDADIYFSRNSTALLNYWAFNNIGHMTIFTPIVYHYFTCEYVNMDGNIIHYFIDFS